MGFNTTNSPAVPVPSVENMDMLRIVMFSALAGISLLVLIFCCLRASGKLRASRGERELLMARGEYGEPAFFSIEIKEETPQRVPPLKLPAFGKPLSKEIKAAIEEIEKEKRCCCFQWW